MDKEDVYRRERMDAQGTTAGGSIRGVIPVLKIAKVVGKEYGVRPDELVKARSPWREARRVLIEMSYRLNMSYRPLQKLGDELGGIGGAAVAPNHNRIQKHMLNDRRFAKRVEKIYKSILSQ